MEKRWAADASAGAYAVVETFNPVTVSIWVPSPIVRILVLVLR
jgi:hypothetical protein